MSLGGMSPDTKMMLADALGQMSQGHLNVGGTMMDMAKLKAARTQQQMADMDLNLRKQQVAAWNQMVGAAGGAPNDSFGSDIAAGGPNVNWASGAGAALSGMPAPTSNPTTPPPATSPVQAPIADLGAVNPEPKVAVGAPSTPDSSTMIRALGPEGAMKMMFGTPVNIYDRATGNTYGVNPLTANRLINSGSGRYAVAGNIDTTARPTVIKTSIGGRDVSGFIDPISRKFVVVGDPGAPTIQPLSELGKVQYDATWGAGGSGARTPAPAVPGSAPGTAAPNQTGAQPSPYSNYIKKITQTPGEATLEQGGATDVTDYAKQIREQANDADTTIPDIQQLQAARRIFQKTGTLGEYQNWAIGAAQNLGLGNLVKDLTGNDPLKSQAAAGQIIDKVTTAAGFANKPDAINRLTQQEVQNLSRIFPGAINQSDDAANVMMGLKLVQLQQKQKMRNALEGMIDPNTGAPPLDLRRRMLPYTLQNNAEQSETINRLMGTTFGQPSLPKGWTLQGKDAQGRVTATDPNGRPHVWVPN